MKKEKKRWIAAGSLLLYIFFMGLIAYFIGLPMVEFLKEPSQFREFVDSYGIWGRLLFVLMVVLQVIVAFIPGEPIEFVAGYAFGFWEGTVLTLVGFVLGSGIVFLMVRKYGTILVEAFFPAEKIKRFSFLNHPKKSRTLALLLMLIPGTPKDFISYFAGLTTLSLKSWILIVAVGRIPSLITSTATGAAAGQENYVLSMVMLGITALLTLAGIVYYRHLCKMQQEK